MCRLLMILCLIHAPLFAVTAGDKSPLELTDLRANIDLSTDSATITCKATLKNPDELAHQAQLTLPRDVVPAAQHEGFTLKIAGLARASDSPDSLRWDVAFEGGQSAEIAWTYTVKTVDLPHTHPQGEREVRIALGHMRGFAALPETATFTVSSPGMPPELFGRAEGDTARHDMPVDRHVEDYTLRWLAQTWQSRVDALQKVRDEFSEPQRTHLNRSYTETLVHLADLYALKNQHAALAEVCETLAALETQGGKAITHCGPWAEWRRHAPWDLRRMHALTELGQDAKASATAAKARMDALWPAYLTARGKAQPFDHFDRKRHGNYHDYDWGRTRELYAAALELLGETAAAQAVRDTE